VEAKAFTIHLSLSLGEQTKYLLQMVHLGHLLMDNAFLASGGVSTPPEAKNPVYKNL